MEQDHVGIDIKSHYQSELEGHQCSITITANLSPQYGVSPIKMLIFDKPPLYQRSRKRDETSRFPTSGRQSETQITPKQPGRDSEHMAPSTPSSGVRLRMLRRKSSREHGLPPSYQSRSLQVQSRSGLSLSQPGIYSPK